MDVGKIDTWFPKSLYVKDGILADELTDLELNIKKIYNETSVITRTGMQQVNSIHKSSDDLHTRPEFKNLVDAITFHAYVYLNALGYSDKQIASMKINNMWFNVSYENDYVFPHHHSHSIISGAFYVKTLPDSKIKFFNNIDMALCPENYNDLSYQFCQYDCVPGRLLLFKSDFVHGTEKQSAGEKIVISFNINT